VDVDDVGSGSQERSGSLLIFLKHFDAEKQTIHGISKGFMSRYMKVRDLDVIVRQKMNWRSNIQLRYFEEIKPGMIEAMRPKATFSESEIQNGDIICFQVQLGANESVIPTSFAKICGLTLAL
jgi:ubiquitin carboxyl-terminal hydrolase 7